MSINFLETLDLLKDSYKYIDYRSAVYKKEGIWYPICSVFRFSNEDKNLINDRYKQLDLNKYKTENFEIRFKALEIMEWEKIYNKIDKNFSLIPENRLLTNIKYTLNTPRSRLWLTEEEVKEYNNIHCFHTVPDFQEHYKKFKFLKNELLSLGENDIYEVLRRILQLEIRDVHQNLYISLILPFYIKLNNLNYSNNILTGDVEYHEIFHETEIFFRLFSNPIFSNDYFVTSEKLIIDKNSEDSKLISKNIYINSFTFDFSRFKSDPNFEIKVLSNKILTHENIIEIKKSFSNPELIKYYHEMINEDLDVINNEEDQKQHKKFIQNTEKEFIELDFLQYHLPLYTGIGKLVELCAYDSDFYRILPVILRSLFEYLLRDIFSTCLSDNYKNLYYDTGNSRTHNFSRLIKLSRFLNPEFDSFYAISLHDNIFKNLQDFRKDGNYNIHQIQKFIEPTYAENNKEKFNLTLENLVQLYDKIIKSHKKINNIDQNRLNNYNKKQGSKKILKEVNKNKILEIINLISSIRTEIKTQFQERQLGTFISAFDKDSIQTKIDKLNSELILLRRPNLAYKELIERIDKLDLKFNSKFPHKQYLLSIVDGVGQAFKYAVSNVYNQEKTENKENDRAIENTLKIIIYLLSTSLIISIIVILSVIFS